MRVIAGTARGRALLAPKGMSTRPMMDIVKGSLFNMLESLGGVADDNVLDLFAGSGSLGVEALSRGAARVDFVEQNREACKVIGENLTRLGFAERAQVFTRSVEQFLTPSPAERGRVGVGAYDLVFVDAPYAAKVSEGLLTRLAEWARLEDNALVCVGHHKHESLPERVGALERIKYRCFGASCLSLYRHQPQTTDHPQ